MSFGIRTTRIEGSLFEVRELRAASVFRAPGAPLAVPHYSTLARRPATAPVDLGSAAASGPRVPLLGSTGLKVFGEGEWKVRQHGDPRRRTWREPHPALDARAQEVLARETTECGATDASQVEPQGLRIKLQRILRGSLI